MYDIKNKIGALYAYDIHKDGKVTALSGDGLPDIGDDISYRWVHLDMNHVGTKEWLNSQMDPIVAASLTLEDTRPRIEPHDTGHLLILRGVNLNPASYPEDMVSIRMWISDRLIISVRRLRLMAVVAIRESIEAGKPPRTIGAFITMLAHGLTERMVPVIDDLVDEVDTLEERSLDESRDIRQTLVDIRRSTISLRRYISPQREALSRMASIAEGWFSRSDVTLLRETNDKITRIVEEMDSVRERCVVLSDQLADKRAEEMNRNMMMLSVVAAIFLPLGFLTGLLGVNVGGIPGSNSPYAFAILCFGMAVLGVCITLFFKRLKWI